MIYSFREMEAQFNKDADVYAFPVKLYTFKSNSAENWEQMCSFHSPDYINCVFHRKTGIEEVDVLLEEIHEIVISTKVPARYLNYVDSNFDLTQKRHFYENLKRYFK